MSRLPMPPLAHRAISLGHLIIITALPHGGQRAARENAWSSMAADALQSQARYEANRAVEQAHARHALRGVTSRYEQAAHELAVASAR